MQRECKEEMLRGRKLTDVFERRRRLRKLEHLR